MGVFFSTSSTLFQRVETQCETARVNLGGDESAHFHACSDGWEGAVYINPGAQYPDGGSLPIFDLKKTNVDTADDYKTAPSRKSSGQIEVDRNQHLVQNDTWQETESLEGHLPRVGRELTAPIRSSSSNSWLKDDRVQPHLSV
ncbi:large membrane protein [Anopheles sinensis]|uniref:Large membrane protein n=1 Tax=Anopheles sinensis TaxID=74873 RepID=A0A084VJ11_ANOSI|nr:large membrane protein [Anopheles sinensis]